MFCTFAVVVVLFEMFILVVVSRDTEPTHTSLDVFFDTPLRIISSYQKSEYKGLARFGYEF